MQFDTLHAVRAGLSIVLVASAVACVSAGGLPGKPGCFALGDSNQLDPGSWTMLNDSTLIVRRADGAYLIKLSVPVFDLPFRHNLDFDDVEHSGKICSDSRDYLLVSGYRPPRVMITSVRQLSPSEAARLLKSGDREVHGK